MKKLTQDEFIRRAREVHGDKYDYSKIVYASSNKKVKIVCPTHGVFWQRAGDHLRGSGCQKCYEDRRGDSKRLDNVEFLKRAKDIHGNKYDYSNVKYVNSKTKVCIICPEHGEFWQTPHEHGLRGGGCPLCRNVARRRMLYGIAFYDVIESMVGSEEFIVSSMRWRSMLNRCYDKKVHINHPRYEGCTVCNEWLLFSNFKEWFDKHYVEGWCLDKDILVKGNKVYSPQTCCFVPNEINVIFSNKTRPLDLPKGVTLNKHGKFVARTRINGVETRIGQYNNAIDAFNAYKREKEKWIKEVADKWKDQLEPRVYEALYNYKVEITD